VEWPWKKARKLDKSGDAPSLEETTQYMYETVAKLNEQLVEEKERRQVAELEVIRIKKEPPGFKSFRLRGTDAFDIKTPTSRRRGRSNEKEASKSGTFINNPLQYSSKYTASTLRQMYKYTSVVRSCVDGIVRIITSLPWTITYIAAETNSGFTPSAAQRERREELIAFLKKPNVNPETSRSFWSKFLEDLLVLDIASIEKVYNIPKSKILELVVRDASTIIPRLTREGVLYRYDQVLSGGERSTVKFTPDEMIFSILNPTSYSYVGTPILESIVNETAAVLYSTKYIANSFTDDEIPPGILHLGHIGTKAYERLKDSFETERGEHSRNKMKVVDNVDIVEWIELTRKEMEKELSALIGAVERIIIRSFGWAISEMGTIQDINRSTAQVQERAPSRLLVPCAKIIAEVINEDLLATLGDQETFKFQWMLPRWGDVNKMALADKNYIASGVKTINDVRKLEGLDPIPGGDIPFIIVGNEIIPVDQIRNQQVEANTFKEIENE